MVVSEVAVVLGRIVTDEGKIEMSDTSPLCELCHLRQRVMAGKCKTCWYLISDRALRKEREAEHFARMAQLEATRIAGPCENCGLCAQVRPNAWCIACLNVRRLDQPVPRGGLSTPTGQSVLAGDAVDSLAV